MLRRTFPRSGIKLTRSLALNRSFIIPEQTAITWSSKGMQIRLHVKPNSKVDRIIETGEDSIHIAIVEAAKHGEANRGIMKLMARMLGIRKTDISIIAGAKSRQKVLLITSESWTTGEHGQREGIARIYHKLQQATSQ